MCDVYSYGMVVYELLTHVVPYHDTMNESRIMQLSLKGIRPMIETETELRKNDILNVLIDMFDKCTELDPDKRPTFSQICKTLNTVQLPNRIEKIVDKSSECDSIQTFSNIQDAIKSVAPEILITPLRREPGKVINMARTYVQNIVSANPTQGESLGVKNKAKLPITTTTDGKRMILPTRPLNPPLIKVMPGTYSLEEPILLDRNVHIMGIGTVDDVIVETGAGNDLLILRNSQKATIQNITFRAAMLLRRVSSSIDDELHVSDMTTLMNGTSNRSSLLIPKKEGPSTTAIIKMQGTDCHSTFTGCKLRRVQINIEDGADPFITKCRVIDSNLMGIYIHGNETKGTIMGNDISRCKGGNIYVDQFADPVIEKNNIHRSGLHGIVLGSKTAGYIIDNVISENAASGILIHQDADPIIETNVIHQNEQGVRKFILIF
jgi:parallel beta-helix repeat protein